MIFGHTGVKPRALPSKNVGVTAGHESHTKGNDLFFRTWVEEADG